MSDKELSEKVALLKDGQIVEIDSNRYKAIKVSPWTENIPCYFCEIDSNCRYNVFFVCYELNSNAEEHYFLKLIS